LNTDCPTAAGFINNDYLLTEDRRQFGGRDARDDIGDCAGRNGLIT